MRQWIPKRVDIVLMNGEKMILDVGKDATVTVIIKGPHVDLKLETIKELRVEYDDTTAATDYFKMRYPEGEII